MTLADISQLREIERLAATVEKYRDHEPLIWSGAMRLYGESISDLVGARQGLVPEEFEHRGKFLQSLHDRALIDGTAFQSLDQIRRFGNKILHEKAVDPSPIELESTWKAYQQLAESRFWAVGRAVGGQSASAYTIEELASEIVEAYGPKIGAFFKKGALPIAGLAIGAFLLHEYGKYLDSDEYKENQRKIEEKRQKEEQRQRGIAEEQRKREVKRIARQRAANEKLKADITIFLRKSGPWIGLFIIISLILANIL